jgi:prevent-host-death family protein
VCGAGCLFDSGVIPYDLLSMKIITARKARTNLSKLIDETAATSEPVQIRGRCADAVLVSMSDWQALQRVVVTRKRGR